MTYEEIKEKLEEAKMLISKNRIKEGVAIFQNISMHVSEKQLENKILLVSLNVNRIIDEIQMGMSIDQTVVNSKIFSVLQTIDEICTEIDLKSDLPFRSSDSYYESDLCNKLVDLFEFIEENNDTKLIVEIGSIIAEALWHRGFYSTLDKIGAIIEDSASREKNHELQCEALIEHLGWMYACQGEIERGKDLINEGVKLAKNKAIFTWASKGNRHLAAIQYKRGNYQKSNQFLLEALRNIEKIKNEKQKVEQFAPTYYGLAELNIALDNLEHAEDYNLKSQNYYNQIDIPYKAVKLYAQKGKIAEKKGDLLAAKNIFHEGLNEAVKHKRNDEEIRNCYGLSRIYDRLGEQTKSKKYKSRAEKIEKTTPLVYT